MPNNECNPVIMPIIKSKYSKGKKTLWLLNYAAAYCMTTLGVTVILQWIKYHK